MLKKRKAQGLSINTIILVVIGLIVLVIIIAILTGRMGLFSKGLESAASCENTCKAIGKTGGTAATNGTCTNPAAIHIGECCCTAPTTTPTPATTTATR